MKQFTNYFLAIVLCTSLCACSSQNISDNTEIKEKNITNNAEIKEENITNNTEIKNSSDAIYAVKSHPFYGNRQIAEALKFNNYHTPRYGSETAKKKGNGSWDVKICGSMSGYTDEYAKDFETKQFTVYAEVEPNGTVKSISVSGNKIF